MPQTEHKTSGPRDGAALGGGCQGKAETTQKSEARARSATRRAKAGGQHTGHAKQSAGSQRRKEGVAGVGTSAGTHRPKASAPQAGPSAPRQCKNQARAAGPCDALASEARVCEPHGHWKGQARQPSRHGAAEGEWEAWRTVREPGKGSPKKRSRSRSCGYGCSEATGEGTKPGPRAGWPPPLFSSFHAATVEGQEDTLHARPAINLPHPNKNPTRKRPQEPNHQPQTREKNRGAPEPTKNNVPPGHGLP